MPTFAAVYDYAPGSGALRDQHRPRHRDFLRALLVEPGTPPADGDRSVRLLASGPWVPDAGATDTAGPGAGALLLLRAPDAGAVHAVLDRDPFVEVGAVATRSVRGWDPVMGPWAG